MEQPPAPFDAETWRRMVELVEFLRVREMPPDAQDRLGQAIVRLRLSQIRERASGVSACRLPGSRRCR